jgi:hypothetical protein
VNVSPPVTALAIVAKRGLRSLMAVFNTASLTNWWPHT